LISKSKLNTVHGNQLFTCPWLQMTNVLGLGTRNASFSLPNPATGGYTVEVTSDLVNWLPLGPATPRYQFTDTNAPAGPTRYYRLRQP
jgi:hypothetical protein